MQLLNAFVTGPVGGVIVVVVILWAGWGLAIAPTVCGMSLKTRWWPKLLRLSPSTAVEIVWPSGRRRMISHDEFIAQAIEANRARLRLEHHGLADIEAAKICTWTMSE